MNMCVIWTSVYCVLVAVLNVSRYHNYCLYTLPRVYVNYRHYYSYSVSQLVEYYVSSMSTDVHSNSASCALSDHRLLVIRLV